MGDTLTSPGYQILCMGRKETGLSGFNVEDYGGVVGI